MNALVGGPLEWLLPIGILIAALVCGPLPIVVRGFIRALFGPKFVQGWFSAATLGLGVGMIGSVGVVATLDSSLVSNTALLCLLLLLASIDWQWRWLPIEWTLAVIALGLIFALQSDDSLQVLMQIAVPATVLLTMRQLLLWTLKKEAMGLGDVWLMAGLGAFLAPFASFLLIGFAALSGLIEVWIRKLTGHVAWQRTGVSYGTHLCIIFVLIRNFTTLG